MRFIRKPAGWFNSSSAPTLSADYTDMIYARTAAQVQAKRKAFLRKWKLKCRAVADSLEEAGDRLFTFLRYPESQWRSIRTSNAIERLHEEFRRRIKIQCVLPCAQTVCMLFWALLASGQIVLRKVDGWQTLDEPPCVRETIGWPSCESIGWPRKIGATPGNFWVRLLPVLLHVSILEIGPFG